MLKIQTESVPPPPRHKPSAPPPHVSQSGGDAAHFSPRLSPNTESSCRNHKDWMCWHDSQLLPQQVLPHSLRYSQLWLMTSFSVKLVKVQTTSLIISVVQLHKVFLSFVHLSQSLFNSSVKSFLFLASTETKTCWRRFFFHPTICSLTNCGAGAGCHTTTYILQNRRSLTRK